VNPYATVLSKSHGDKAKWKGSPANLAFLVCFGDRSPFTRKHFHRNKPLSGAITARPEGVEEYFKYSIEVGSLELDPGIIIKG
jgi:hypothetical protein